MIELVEKSRSINAGTHFSLVYNACLNSLKSKIWRSLEWRGDGGGGDDGDGGGDGDDGGDGGGGGGGDGDDGGDGDGGAGAGDDGHGGGDDAGSGVDCGCKVVI